MSGGGRYGSGSSELRRGNWLLRHASVLRVLAGRHRLLLGPLLRKPQITGRYRDGGILYSEGVGRREAGGFHIAIMGTIVLLLVVVMVVLLLVVVRRERVMAVLLLVVLLRVMVLLHIPQVDPLLVDVPVRWVLHSVHCMRRNMGLCKGKDRTGLAGVQLGEGAG